jgi:hypothetical protein
MTHLTVPIWHLPRIIAESRIKAPNSRSPDQRRDMLTLGSLRTTCSSQCCCLVNTARDRPIKVEANERNVLQYNTTAE